MTRLQVILLVSILLVALVLPQTSTACTNFIASKGATVDGSVIVTYTCDGEFHPHLKFKPAADYGPDEYFEIKTWGGKLKGKVKQPAHTYAVVNLMNEHQLTIGETTTTGRDELTNPDGLLGYWHLMQLTLQRAKTAREAIAVMGELVADYGYNSTAESFMIGDPDEAWIMEMVGPGKGGDGAYWVALRVPDGYVSAFANGGRITTFDTDDPDNCLFSPGIAEYATANGWFDPDLGQPFNWRDAFHPQTAQQLRYTATRVWSLFRRCAPSQLFTSDYHRGVENAEAYPLWIKPDEKLSVADVFSLMRDHYEGTVYDMTVGVDAGPYGNPSRWRPMGWNVDGQDYTWERPISTQQTGFSMITQSRSWLPDAIGGLTWYGLDDTWFTCYTPLYCGITATPPVYNEGTMNLYSTESAWWVFNFVSNYAATKFSYINEDVQLVQKSLEGNLLAIQPAVEHAALYLAENNPELLATYLTDYSVLHAEDVVNKWRDLGHHLVTRYNDGYVKNDKGRVTEKGYPEAWLRAVLQARPENFSLPMGDKEQVCEPKDY